MLHGMGGEGMSFIISPVNDLLAFEADPLKTVVDQAVSEVSRLVDYAVKHSDVDRKEYISAIIKKKKEKGAE